MAEPKSWSKAKALVCHAHGNHVLKFKSCWPLEHGNRNCYAQSSVTQGEPYSQLVQSAWRRKSDAEGIYLSIWKSMQLCVFIHLTYKQDKAAALLDSGATENFI